MTPFNVETTAFVNPEIPSSELQFGKLEKKFFKLIGTVQKTKYFHPKRTMSYFLFFEEHSKGFWFLEKEILPVYQK